MSKALEERGIVPDVIAGVSIGAFNGAIIAANPGCATAALESFWDQLTVCSQELFGGQLDEAVASWHMMTFGSPNFLRPMDPADLERRAAALPMDKSYDTSPMKALVERYVDFSKLKNGPIRLLVSAVNVETAELEVFDSYGDDLPPSTPGERQRADQLSMDYDQRPALLGRRQYQ